MGAWVAGLLLSAALAWQGAAAQQTCKGGGSSLPSARFHDNGDGTVTDEESKLMWMRCAIGQQWRARRCTGVAATYPFAEAQRQADQLSRDGGAFFNDWRVPALRELATITDRSCTGSHTTQRTSERTTQRTTPRTNLAVFPGTPATPFWTSTARPGDDAGERVLALSFGPEGVLLARKDDHFHVRLVRTGP